MLAFDIGGCATEGAVPMTSEQVLCDPLCNIEVPDWHTAAIDPGHYRLRDCCNPTKQSVHMLLDVNAAQRRIKSFEAEGVIRGHHGHMVGAIEQKTRLTSKQRGLRDTVVFFAFTCNSSRNELESSFVGIECIEIFSQLPLPAADC